MSERLSELPKREIHRRTVASFDVMCGCEREWVSVKERLPEEMATCIVFVDEVEDMGARVDIAFFNVDSKGWGTYSLHNWAGGNITHWMPLPKPPNDNTFK